MLEIYCTGKTSKDIMVIKSIYKTMTDDADKIPVGTNIKMVFRHSFRDTLQGVEDPDIIPLNHKGKQAAIQFGMNISAEIGQMHSSFVPRCIQTLECIKLGAKQQIPIVVSREILGEGFAVDKKLADRSFKSIGSLKGVANLLACGVSVAGFHPIARTTRFMLDYIFKNGNENGKLDMYCTHDFHIALMICKIFDIKEQKDIILHWPHMLEGFFVWGSRENFSLIWRGRCKHLINFLLD